MSLDVFRQRAFRTTELLDHIRKMPYIPTQLRDMGLFTTRSIRNRGFYVTQKDSVLKLIGTSPVGAPPETVENDLREAIPMHTSRLAMGDRLMAEELQSVLADESETQLKNVAGEVDMRLQQLRRNMELTKEHMRLGAINGRVLDADGSTVVADYYEKFGVVKPADIAFGLAAATRKSLAEACDTVVRHMETEGGAAVQLGQATIYALCGKDFWRALITNEEIVEVYMRAQNVNLALNRQQESLSLNSIEFMRYRGTADDTVGVAADECRFVVSGADMFREVYSPAEFQPFINTLGQPEYPMTVPDEKRGAHVDIELYSYPLMLCERPRMLLTGTVA